MGQILVAFMAFEDVAVLIACANPRRLSHFPSK